MLLVRGIFCIDRYYSRVVENIKSSIGLVLQPFGFIERQCLLQRPHSEATFLLYMVVDCRL